jgi:hypothetical protein
VPHVIVQLPPHNSELHHWLLACLLSGTTACDTELNCLHNNR